MPIVAAFILALLLSLLFVPDFRRGAFGSFVIFFFILFMGGIFTQYWIIPFGPVWWGVTWMPLLFILLIFTFLLVIPSPYERRRMIKTNESNTEENASAAISIFVWLVFTILLIAILIGIFRIPML